MILSCFEDHCVMFFPFAKFQENQTEISKRVDLNVDVYCRCPVNIVHSCMSIPDYFVDISLTLTNIFKD